MKMYYIIFGFVFTLIGILILVAVFDKPEPIKENIFFENTEKDSLSEMKSKIREYVDVLEDYTFYDVGETDSVDIGTVDDQVMRYDPEDFDTDIKKSDIRDINFSYVPVGWFYHTLDQLSSTSVNCLFYTEGDQCKHSFNKEWVEYHMDGDEMYINFYRHYKSSFIHERDEIVNIEYYLNKVDGKIQMIVGINTYNLLTDTKGEITYHFLEDSYLEAYYGGNTFEYFNYETKEYLYYNHVGFELEVHHFNPENNVLIHYVDSYEDEWEYHLYEEEEDIFFYTSHQNFIRYDLQHVENWDHLKKRGDGYYNLFLDKYTIIVEDIYVSPLGETPYFYLDLDEVEITEEVLDLSYLGLSFEYDTSDMLTYIDDFDTNLIDLLGRFGLTRSGVGNDTLFTEKMLNEDDSHMIPK